MVYANNFIWNVAIDPSNTSQDEVYFAYYGSIRRSTNGGASFTRVLNGTNSLSPYTDLAITSTGVCYATLSSAGDNPGIFRSTDGISWTDITPAGFPYEYRRIVIGIAPSNENVVYFLGETPNTGTLEQYPGIRSRYSRLVEAHIAQRLPPEKLPQTERAQEEAIRAALQEPGSVEKLPQTERPPLPVPLWLHPFPPVVQQANVKSVEPDDEGERGETKDLEDDHRRQAERADKPEAEDKGLITIRMENIFSWGEFVKLDRSSEENEDLDDAADAAQDMDLMSVSRDAKSSAGKLRFDLDLPSEAEDDLVLSEGILLPEWDFKKKKHVPDYCRLFPMISADAESMDLPEHLRKTARKLRAQFQHLAPARIWHRQQQDGCEIDLDAYLRFTTDKAAGHVTATDGLYKDLRVGARDLACLLLADLSLSTDTWVDDHSRVIDVIRDSLFLFAESLAATGDQFRHCHIRVGSSSYSGSPAPE